MFVYKFDRNECIDSHRHDQQDNVDRYCFNRMIGYRMWYGTAQDIDIGDFICQNQNDISYMFEISRSTNEVIKYNFEMDVKFYRNTLSETGVLYTTARFYIPLTTFDVNELNSSNHITAKLAEKLNDFNGRNIGWMISQINYVRLCWGCYESPKTGSFIPTPKWISTKRALVNIQCFDDNNSFQYSVLAGINIIRAYSHNINCPAWYKLGMHLLNMDGIPTPVRLSSIDAFEKQNPEISVNVLRPDDDDRDIIAQ